ncbi:helix-turn-helix transcriptional regulator (plasmid) [Tistrella mobilis]|uniref:helix-turn-helix domain-containing protein n=1 Tax=Tistrella mobilis TaxID=171437 RepID=UPI00355700BB
MDDVELNRIDIAVGGRIRRRRTTLRLSQTTLGQMAGVTFQQVQKYENGTNRVAASRLMMIGRALGVSTAYFFEDVEPAAMAGQMPRASDPETIALVAAYWCLPDRLRADVHAMIQSMADQYEGPRTTPPALPEGQRRAG